MIKAVKNLAKKNKAIYHLAKFFKKKYNIYFWKFNKAKLPISDGIYIHLGCGDISHPEMINVDLRPDKHIHYLSSVEKLPMFPDNYADLIYLSHCLEHIPYVEINTVLLEWFRVLKSGGILRISVPDFDVMLKMYQKANNDIDYILSPLFGGQDYEYNFHYNAFTEKSLMNNLFEKGFREVQHWNYNTDRFSKFNDWSNRNITVLNEEFKISLNIQGTKP